MTKKVFVTLGLSALVGLSVGIGTNVGQVKEAKADAAIYIRENIYFEKGNDIFLQLKEAWSYGNAKFAFRFSGGNSTSDFWSDYVTTANDLANDGYLHYRLPNNLTENYTKIVAARFSPDREAAPSLSGEGYWSSTSEITFNSTSNNCIWTESNQKMNDGGGQMSFNSFYQLSDSTSTYIMHRHNDSEVKATFTATKGANITVTYGADSSAGTLNPNSKASNNLTSSKTIKVGGEISVFLTKSNWSVWATGYAPSSAKLQDFCDAILAANCDAAGLASVGSSSAFTALEASDKITFNAATVSLGDGVSFASVVDEAATRYAHLIAKGANPLTGIDVSSTNSLLTPTINNSNNLALITALVSTISLLVVGGFFFIRKRKENK